MKPDDNLFKLLLETFNTELEALLVHITTHLQKIKSEDHVSLVSLKATISQAGRTIKVSAIAVGVVDVGRIAEHIEKLFGPNHPLSPELIDLAFRAVDGMREAMHDFIKHKPLSGPVSDLLVQLDYQVHREEKVEPPPNPQKVCSTFTPFAPFSPIISENLDNAFIKKIVETFKSELHENLIIITEGLLRLEKGVKSDHDFRDILEEIFRIAHNIKGSAQGIGATDVGEIAHQLEVLFAEMKSNGVISHEMINLCFQAIDFIKEAIRCYSEDIPLSIDLQNHLLQLKHAKEIPQQTLLPNSELSTTKTLKPKKANKSLQTALKINEFESIRVSLRNLEKISTFIEELQTHKFSIEEQYTKLTKLNIEIDHLVASWKKSLFNLKSFSNHEFENLSAWLSTLFAELSGISKTTHIMQRELRVSINELSVLLNALQDEVCTVRLIPVSNQLRHLPRIVRDLAYDLKKQIHLDINSNHIKMDQIILDGLEDPIMHIVRNALDHGIETPEVRKALGKSPQGSLIIEVTQEDNHIVFRISDDGAGIKIDEVTRIALQKKFITTAERDTMNQDDVLALIFRPGFSTREIVTDISGRGVGLDVVRSNLLRLKGHVHLTSQPGKGTDFFLQVPLTVATERGVILSCAGQIYVLTTNTVESVLWLQKEDMVTLDRGLAVLVKDQPVLVRSLAKILHFEEQPQKNKDHFSVVVLKKNEESIALLVDEIIGEREIVLKPLQEPLTNIPCVIGATLTGNNQISFVLQAAEIIKRALLLE